MALLVVVVVSLLLLAGRALGVSCLDENGNRVDWFAALKTPNGYTYYAFDGHNFTVLLLLAI